MLFAHKLPKTLGEETRTDRCLGELISSGDRKAVEHFVTNEVIL